VNKHVSMARLLAVLLLWAASPAGAQTPEQWTEWGERVHGGFGSLIAYGIRVGNDALARLGAERREVTVEYTDGPATPCACALDGVAIAVSASLGQRTMKLMEARTEAGLLARIKFTSKKTGQSLTYELPMSAMPVMGAINKDVPVGQRWAAVAKLDPGTLYTVR
jgi:hypothetical protein